MASTTLSRHHCLERAPQSFVYDCFTLLTTRLIFQDNGIEAFYNTVRQERVNPLREQEPASSQLYQLVLSLLQERCRAMIAETRNPPQAEIPRLPEPQRRSVPTQTGPPDEMTLHLINTKYIAFMQHLSQRGRTLASARAGNPSAQFEQRVEHLLHETMCQLFANPKMILVVRDIMLNKLQEPV
ncbi:hypothetical protein ACHHYP_20070 [Achlya hypogyna]|uniref:Uncharacterized protein n=1 Tax=Achlya hypogyna TaxID=1202772 RepID=A0A1V9ZT54_ACHHY|nr:hypothetical protein ACHHYP_20070 [Achlya hypogyna]